MMSTSVDPFQSTKLHILKQKYEYMTHYLAETEARLAQIKGNNRRLRNTLEQLHQQQDTPRDQQEELNACLKICKEEEREKTRRIQELKRLIAEYKYLCQEAVKSKAPQTARTRPFKAANEGRENSFFSAMESSENENINNVSVSRNKSYQKVKTKLYCQNCETQFRPNQYYRHLQNCQAHLNSSQLHSRMPQPNGRSMRQ